MSDRRYPAAVASTTRLKPSKSVAARWAKLLRSRSILALFSRSITTEYDNPNFRAAALIRIIHNARETVQKGLAYAYRDRRARKREFRALWIIRINAAARQLGLSYSVVMDRLKKANIDLDRKSLAHLAATDFEGFRRVVEATAAG